MSAFFQNILRKRQSSGIIYFILLAIGSVVHDKKMAFVKQAKPVVKWVGGKRQLLREIVPLLPDRDTPYCEPFLGGGAVLFELQPTTAIINDINADLMGVYEVIRDDVESLIEILSEYKNTKEFFYTVRDLDRNKNVFSKLSKVEKAARTLYLNKTCFNGLFRVNSSGEFNSPYGYYKNPNIVNETVLRAVNEFFSDSNISFHNEDFSAILERITKDTFVYLDPPYDPVSGTSNFTGYNRRGFDREEQKRLKEYCDKLTQKGIRFLLSNSATDFIKELYRDYDITIVQAKRSVNSNGKKRGAIEEVLIKNYGIK